MGKVAFEIGNLSNPSTRKKLIVQLRKNSTFRNEGKGGNFLDYFPNKNLVES